jgi:mono/diheme cytochrome c family protein
MKGFFLGIVVTLVVLAGEAYLFLTRGGISMDTSAPPLPLEKTVAGMALRASIGNAADQKNPLPFNDDSMLSGARTYKQNCAVCHGVPSQPPTAISKGMFPDPPQLFEKMGMMTDDPEGETFWKVTHGIRLSGMPGFSRTLSDTERWQVTTLISHADRLSPAVHAELVKP